MAFNHTHTIKIASKTGTKMIPVDAGGTGPADGPLYTREEAASYDSADWEMLEGELHFQGKPAGFYEPGATVELLRAPR